MCKRQDSFCRNRPVFGFIKRKITDLVEKNQILPQLDSREFTLSETEKALEFVAKGDTDGKVIIRF